jgi:hypothetical protein
MISRGRNGTHLVYVFHLLALLLAARLVDAQNAVTEHVTIEAEELTSAYGAPPDLSRGRISTLTKSYVLPPLNFEVETIYNADVSRHGPPRHLFTQEIELGLPGRVTVGIANQLERFDGDGGEHTFGIEARYALANWNKIPLNPTLSAEYKFGFGGTSPTRDVPDTVDFGLIMSQDFRHMVEWALNVFVDQEVNGTRALDWGFAQSIEVPVLLPEEQLEIGLEMQYRHADKGENARGLVIGPTIGWRPTKNVRIDLSPLFGCTDNSPRTQIFVVATWFFGKPEAGETETPASTRGR